MKTQSMAQKFFSADEQKQISDAVHLAELKTSGELVPMLVCESHSYPLAAVRGGTLVASIGALLGSPMVARQFWLEPTNVWVFLALFVPLFLLTHFLIKIFPGLKRWFLSSSEKDEEVQNSAFAAFFTEKLYKTKDANGILIYISLLERRAWIIADSGINKRIPQEKWQDAVAVITDGIRRKEQCQALCKAIAMVGDILEKEFPIQDDDRNELHNLIIC
ncbi:putative membrane protein [Desulfocapsa sulfexigens DSM 10523]|uniref:Putative membrane protein n=1 Tax=Desulfocapsa sulfexigens (strain DSM 10523 / SB164P1) TaxID=1167006 RepID=M1PGW7_DESSD|nr:TPM domain-containing protein [Desulfocapsa sulfexigens]AGF78875.1 putative membrane protein [Desulfocapsa sulfexigens DSM 10523]